MTEAYICDAIRTPIGRYAGALSTVRPDDLGATPIRELLQRNPSLSPGLIDDVIMGCANQAGEDNRNVARMSALLAGLPTSVAGVTVNRLCGSGMDAVAIAARAIKSGETQLMIAGGVESMSRAPLVMGKAETAFSRQAEIFDTTIGWRFINPLMRSQYGVESMPETAENVAADFGISREDQDAFALRSQLKAVAAQASGRLAEEIVAVTIPQRRQDALIIDQDEHPRADTSLESLTKLKAPFREGGCITAGNASGVNDGACALLLASEKAADQHRLTPKARVVAAAVAGVEPRIMGYGPVPAINKLLEVTGLAMPDFAVIELNEAFAAQALACSRALHIADDDERLNPNGGAIALGHPLGMSGARLITTATYQLHRTGGRYALCAMCIGVGQGIAIIIERI
ncbi:MAG: 3-oxoadipyl-CoA thiolase [Pseudomonadales bacterium]|nr:3-oxoadipyl-CoA thiolase [Pseudomonadales bacterium]